MEKRKTPRLPIAAAAVVFADGEEVGEFAVDNLSAGGALLSGDIIAHRGDTLTVMLRVGDEHPLELDATVVRFTGTFGKVSAIAVQFEHHSSTSEDVLIQVLYGGIEGLEVPFDNVWGSEDPDLIDIVPRPPG